MLIGGERFALNDSFALHRAARHNHVSRADEMNLVVLKINSLQSALKLSI